MTVRAKSGLGELRSRIRLSRVERSPSGDMDFDEQVTEVAKLWARFDEISPSAYQGDGTADPGTPSTVQFRVRYRPGLLLPDVTYVVLYAGRRYRVMRTRRDDQKGDYLVLYCSPRERAEVGAEPAQAPTPENWA